MAKCHHGNLENDCEYCKELSEAISAERKASAEEINRLVSNICKELNREEEVTSTKWRFVVTDGRAWYKQAITGIELSVFFLIITLVVSIFCLFIYIISVEVINMGVTGTFANVFEFICIIITFIAVIATVSYIHSWATETN